MSLAKAGVVCSLPARASILAAANPTGGHYNKAKTVSENLKSAPPSPPSSHFPLSLSFLSPSPSPSQYFQCCVFVPRMSSALLSRFDLVGFVSLNSVSFLFHFFSVSRWQVFILLDKPDVEMDSILSEHVMALHSGTPSSSSRMYRLVL